MRTFKIIITLSLTLILVTVYGQDSLSQSLTDIYWGISIHNISGFTDSATLHLDKMTDEIETLTPPFKGGFIFKRGGEFNEIALRTCGYDRHSYTGIWTMQSDTVVVKIMEGLTWYFQVISITDEQLITKYWINNE